MGDQEMPEELESREERADSGAKRSLDRAMAACGVEEPEEFLDLLEDDPDSREAAAGAFWYTYVVQRNVARMTRVFRELEDDPKLTSEEAARIRMWPEGRLEKPRHFKRWLQDYLFAEPMATDSEPPRSNPHVRMLLATGLLTLLISEAQGWSRPPGRIDYDEDIVDALEIARTCTGLMTDREWLHGHGIEVYEDEWIEADDGDLVFSPLIASIYSACGIFLAEYGAFEARKGNFEQAFLHLSDAAQRFSIDDGLAVPHLGEPFNHVERPPGWTSGAGFSQGMEELMVVWESLTASPYREHVQRWADLADACKDLAIFPLLPEETEGAIFRRGDPGESVDVSEYWWKAYAFAVGQTSPSAAIEAVIRRDRERHGERLEKDFFADCWFVLEENTRRCLISTEMGWYDAGPMGGRVSGMLNELRLAFEYELRVMFVKPKERQIQSILDDRDRRDQFNLHSRDAKSINLGDIAKLLERADAKSRELLCLRMLIEDAGLDEKEKRFVRQQIPCFSKRLWEERNKPEHGRRSGAATMRQLRREALGIGCEGMLPRLARLKRRLIPQAERTRRLGRGSRRLLPGSQT